MMKKVLILILCILFCLFCCACDTENKEKETKNNSETTTQLIDQENVKISFKGISSNLGVGEGISLLVENSREESIIINVSEVSLNDEMQPVIQPQMPLNLTSPGKKSTQTFVFTNSKDLKGKTQFKIKVLSENYEEIFTTDFIDLNLE